MAGLAECYEEGIEDAFADDGGDDIDKTFGLRSELGNNGRIARQGPLNKGRCEICRILVDAPKMGLQTRAWPGKTPRQMRRIVRIPLPGIASIVIGCGLKTIA